MLSFSNSRNHALDAWRGLAALGVLGAHLSDRVATFYPNSIFRHGGSVERFLLHGQIGVDIFFLISGYIVFLSALKLVSHGSCEAGNFSLKRGIRIYAPYLPVAILMGIAYSLFPELSRADASRSVSWVKSLTLLPSPGDYSLSVAWTLTYEIFFYCVVAVSLFFSRKSERLVAVSIPSCIAIVYAAVTGRFVFGGTSSPWTVLSSAWNLEFFAGCALAFAVSKLSGGDSSNETIIQPVSQGLSRFVFLAAVAIMCIPASTTFVYRAGLLALVALTISPLASASISRFAICRALAALGLFSYSLYLVHNPLQSLLVRISVTLGLSSVASALILIVLPIAFAALYYSVIESKSLGFIKAIGLRVKA